MYFCLDSTGVGYRLQGEIVSCGGHSQGPAFIFNYLTALLEFLRSCNK